jgi:uncharacterized heparinase superfamily protein
MDSAIRAANWLFAMEFFTHNSNLLDKEFLTKVYSSLYDHGFYIRRNLQKIDSITTNHYIAGISGLLFISLYCPFFEKSKEWKEFALKALEAEIEKQIYPDGCDYEASTSYHLLVLEIIFYSLLLCERAGVFLPKSYNNKLKRMFEASLYYLKTDKMAPQIGDNDNGRYFKLSNKPILEHKYLLILAATYFKDKNFKLKHFEFDEEAFWVFGNKGKELYDNLPSRKEPITSKVFPNAGWYIMRHEDTYCFISCGPNGQNGNGGHAHNDKLSFELMLDGKDIIIDPGTYVYTPYPVERNKFRSTESHNTIQFNGCEQNEIPKKNMFSLPDSVNIKYATLKETADQIRFEGEIQYLNFTHKRMIILDKKHSNLQITDKISTLKPVMAKLRFHLSPDVYYYNSSIYSKKTGRKIASIEINDYKILKGEYDHSPEYGVKMKAECLLANITATKDIQTITTFIKKK